MAMAPALMKGLRGTPASRSSWTIELKAEPEGSRPTRFQIASPCLPSASVSVKTLEILWMEKASSASPSEVGLAVHRHHGDAELFGIDMGEFGNVVGHPALAAPWRQRCVDFLDDRLQIHHHRPPSFLPPLPDQPAKKKPPISWRLSQIAQDVVAINASRIRRPGAAP
jgi:hypothetical protein